MRHILTATLFFCAFFGVSAQEIQVKNLVGPSESTACDLHSLLYPDGKTQGNRSKVKALAASETAVTYEERIQNMPQYLHDFIAEYARASQEVLDGGSNWLSDPVKGEYASSVFYYPLNEVTGSAPFTFPVGASGNDISQAALEAATPHIDEAYDVLKSFIPYAFLCVNLDYPEAFWLNTAYYYGYSTRYGYSYNPYNGTGSVTYTMTLMFYLHDNGSGFDIRNNGLASYNFQDTEQLAAGVKSFHSYVQNILNQCPSDGSRYDKLLAAHDWLTLNNCYNQFFLNGFSQSRIGDTPWSALSALEGNTDQKAPVCEGYSRAFMVLCKEMGIPCILMSGNARTSADGNSGGHMWNYVQMEDGMWYAIDVTWDDPTAPGITDAVSGHETHKWFLMGSETDMGDGFRFIDSHPEEWSLHYSNEGSQAWEFVAGPQLSSITFDEATGIDKPVETGETAYYDLSGRRFNKPLKGIYIQRNPNGKATKRVAEK